MKVFILGHKWKVYVLSKKKFKKRFKGCTAITLINKRKIYLREDRVIDSYVRHEVAHAHMHYTCTEEFSLNRHNMEEFLCDFVAIHGPSILKISKDIIRKLA